jgi:spermidine/putrescine transport system ATP-binding protein
MAESAVELRNVWKRFPGPGGEVVTAVKDVSLKIADGEFFALLGPSGCGKTTSLRMIAGFELPTEGEVYHSRAGDGQDAPLSASGQHRLSELRPVPTHDHRRECRLWLANEEDRQAEIQRRVGEALEMVRLSGYERRKPKQLSGGQQQRVALARALVNRPKCCCWTSR